MSYLGLHRLHLTPPLQQWQMLEPLFIRYVSVWANAPKKEAMPKAATSMEEGTRFPRLYSKAARDHREVLTLS